MVLTSISVPLKDGRYLFLEASCHQSDSTGTQLKLVCHLSKQLTKLNKQWQATNIYAYDLSDVTKYVRLMNQSLKSLMQGPFLNWEIQILHSSS